MGGERRMLRLIRRYGPIMTMPILTLGDVAIVSDPALVKEVFTAPADVLLGGEGVGPAAAIYGSGSMFVQEEPEHLRRRKLLTPPLHGPPSTVTSRSSKTPPVRRCAVGPSTVRSRCCRRRGR
ncbi:putative cytochrome P450 [Mycobacterium kansasii]|uniref:Putative cytochrome P450 n=1 Tax=Mycobacterium kansasii TaxID=1768 RepID=A0A1V3X8I5_MYCKA|nr:putative cytochrome P450 [Mycobacterium kansasii]